MLRVGKVGLRARDEADVAVLHAELYEDIATRAQADSRPWLLIPPGSAASPTRSPSPGMTLPFSPLWNWTAASWRARHCCGPSTCITGWLISGCRCGPLSGAAVWARTLFLALCGYGFTIRGLHRLQVDTLASNTAMIRAASRAGFVQEGRLRRSAWVSGDFADEVILGMLATDWVAGRQGQTGAGEIADSRG